MRNLLCLLLILTGCNSKKSTHVVDDVQTPRVLYVINAQSGTYENNKLQLKDIPSVIYFSDRPTRLAGHTALKIFVKNWTELKKDPPNGYLSILKEKSDILVELSNPSAKGTTLTFDVKVLKGKLSKTFESSALFIDQEKPGNSAITHEQFSSDFHTLDCSCAGQPQITQKTRD